MKSLPFLGLISCHWSHAQISSVSGFSVSISALQHLPCPQSTQLEWKGLVMLQAMYALLTVNAFCLSNNPGPMADYRRADPNNLMPLTRTEQAFADTTFAQEKHYFHLLQKIEHACFNALNSSVNDAFKVSNDPTIQGWHMGMTMRVILDQCPCNTANLLLPRWS
jgi:hypothetical protein